MNMKKILKREKNAIKINKNRKHEKCIKDTSDRLQQNQSSIQIHWFKYEV